MKVKFTIKKYGGDDLYSWAVFMNTRKQPIITGLTKSEAGFHKRQLEKELKIAEREKNA